MSRRLAIEHKKVWSAFPSMGDAALLQASCRAGASTHLSARTQPGSTYVQGSACWRGGRKGCAATSGATYHFAPPDVKSPTTSPHGGFPGGPARSSGAARFAESCRSHACCTQASAALQVLAAVTRDGTRPNERERSSTTLASCQHSAVGPRSAISRQPRVTLVSTCRSWASESCARQCIYGLTALRTGNNARPRDGEERAVRAPGRGRVDWKQRSPREALAVRMPEVAGAF